MDTHKSPTRPESPPFHYPAALPDATEKIKSGVPQYPRYTTLTDQPLLNRYHYILDNTKQAPGGEFVTGDCQQIPVRIRNSRLTEHTFAVHRLTPHVIPPSSQAAVDSCFAIKRWIEGESDDDREDDSESTSVASNSGISVTKAASSVCELTNHSKPVSRGIDSSTVPWKVAEAVYGPFLRSNDYASEAGPSATEFPSHGIMEDVRMEEVDRDDRFEDEVMVYYHAALSSSVCDSAFDTTLPPPSSHTPTSAPLERDLEYHFKNMGFAEVFAKQRAREILGVEKGIGGSCPRVAMAVGKKVGVVPPQTGYGRTIYSP